METKEFILDFQVRLSSLEYAFWRFINQGKAEND